MKQSKTMLENAAILFIAMTLTKIIGAVLKIPLGNILGGLGMSYFSSAYSVFSPIYALTAAALPTVITKLVAQNAASGKLQNIRKIKRLAVQTALLLGFFGMITIFVITAPFAVYVANTPKSIPAMLMIAPSLFFCCVSAVYRGYFEGLRDTLPTALSQIIEAVVKAALGIALSYFALLYTGSLPYAAAAAVLGITISEFCGLIFLVIRNKTLGDGFLNNDIETSEPPERAWILLKTVYKEMLPITIAALVINLASFVDLLTITNTINYSIKNNEAFFLEKFTYGFNTGIKPEDLGNFIYGSYSGIVASLFGLVSSMTAMVGRSALPNITSSFELSDKIGLRRNISIVFKGTFLIGFPLSIGLAALANPILSLLYSSKPDEVMVCTPPLFILSLFGITISTAGTLFNIFLVIGRADLVIKLMLIGSALKLFGNFALIQIPELNITGAAISTVLCYTLISVLGFFALKKIADVKSNILSDFIKYAVCSLFCGASAYLTYHYIFSGCDKLAQMFFSLITAVAVYSSAILIIDFETVKNLFLKIFRTKRRLKDV